MSPVTRIFVVAHCKRLHQHLRLQFSLIPNSHRVFGSKNYRVSKRLTMDVQHQPDSGDCHQKIAGWKIIPNFDDIYQGKMDTFQPAMMSLSPECTLPETNSQKPLKMDGWFR